VNIYEPDDDTYLLHETVATHLQQLNKTNISLLEMGGGSGEITVLLKEVFPDNSYLVVDTNGDAVEYMKKRDLEVVESDLFSNIPSATKFDVIFFNTPYLPDEDGDINIDDVALYGGPNGNEVCLRFLDQAQAHLKPTGTIFVLVSSLGGAQEVKRKAIELYGSCEVIATKKEFMEELIVYKIESIN
jgi:release factor glutamine methyltransferase